MKWSVFLLSCLLLLGRTQAQDLDDLSAAREEKKEGVNVSVSVNYGSAYRNDSWVPVDVLVNNYEYDISGHVEVRTVDMNGEVQSPIYRASASGSIAAWTMRWISKRACITATASSIRRE
jgi:hypothetical protein